MKSESQIQSAILNFLRTLGKFRWAVKVEVCSERGVPDILCCYRGRFVGFEVKTAKGKISGPQRVQNERIRRACGRAVIVHCVEDVQAGFKHIDKEIDAHEVP
ncbi:MAG: VRR-NUC domain-containing protein [Planctomycetes bacterium]|nr:VRR-NUC domain-containing protein [Planctomycetota bacterium]